MKKIICTLMGAYALAVYVPVAKAAASLTEFSCDSALKKSNEVILRNEAGFKSISFNFDIIGWASPEANSGLYLTFTGETGVVETALFWSSPIIGLDNKIYALDTIGGSHHNVIWAKGEVLDVAQIRDPKTETASDGDVTITMNPAQISFSVPTIVNSRNDFTKSHSLGKITSLKIGCFYGEYVLTNIDLK